MSQSSFSKSAFQRGMHFTVSMCFALAVRLTVFLPGLYAAESTPLPSRRVAVFCELNENQPAGTLVTRLLDHHLTLSNFRISEPESAQGFSVDARDGSVLIIRDEQCDFEACPRLRLLIYADETVGEDDQFLKQFSAGLVEDGLTVGVVESLSASNVTLDLTISLKDVPEPPKLTDLDLLVPVSREFPVQVGYVAKANQQAARATQYFIVGGNEDDLFTIDPDTGMLSLRSDAALKSDIVSTHELQILAETAGLTTTAVAAITVFNETPVVIPPTLAASVCVPDQQSVSAANEPELSSLATNSDGLPFGLTLKLDYVPGFRFPLSPGYNESEESAAGKNAPKQPVADNTEPGFVLPTFAVPIPDAGPIDVIEFKDWLTPPEDKTTSSTVSANPDPAPDTSPAGPETFSQSVAATNASQKILQSLMAMIVFVVSCVAAAVALSRASAARKAVLDEDAARQSDAIAAERRSFEQMISIEERNAERCESGSSADISTAVAAANAEHEKIADLSEQIRVLQTELAARDQLIAELQARLQADQLNPEEPAAVRDNPEQSQPDLSAVCRQPDALESRHPDTLHTAATSHPVESLSQILQHVESHAAFSSEPDTSWQRPGSQLTGITQSLPVWDMAVESETECSSAPKASATETLDDQEALRAELAELFSIRQSKTSQPSAAIQTEKKIENKTDSVEPDRSENGLNDEDSHLDSVKQYLSQLLERSKEARSAEDILVDRRKADSPSLTVDRRSASDSGRKPVKSFLESYMSAHGGALEVASESTAPTKPEKNAMVPLPDKPRTPIDVKSARESMNSFRAVAIQSVENAVLSHDMRQAKGVIAVRTMMLTGLILVTTFAFLANMLEVIQFSLLPWLMAAAVIFAAIELGLRIQSMRKQRRELMAGKLHADPRPPKRKLKKHDLDDTLVQ